jgi:hypothetical protein
MRAYTATYLLEDGTRGMLALIASNDWDAIDCAFAALDGGPAPHLLRVRAA